MSLGVKYTMKWIMHINLGVQATNNHFPLDISSVNSSETFSDTRLLVLTIWILHQSSKHHIFKGPLTWTTTKRATQLQLKPLLLSSYSLVQLDVRYLDLTHFGDASSHKRTNAPTNSYINYWAINLLFNNKPYINKLNPMRDKDRTMLSRFNADNVIGFCLL